MRVFAISDIHIDFEENRQWVWNLSQKDYQEDILLVAGDIHSKIPEVAKTFVQLKKCFAQIMFVPGNHDLWTSLEPQYSSLEKFRLLQKTCQEEGIQTTPFSTGKLTIVPLLSWYDFSFGKPTNQVVSSWGDFYRCKWPPEFDMPAITKFFLDENQPLLKSYPGKVISFSHFLPRIDVMPIFSKRDLFPVLGSRHLDEQIRTIGSQLHIYGHSHINQVKEIDGVIYFNNAYGYPRETRITRKELICLNHQFDILS